MTGVTWYRITYIVSDFIASNVAWFLFNIFRYYTLPYNYDSMSLSNYYLMDRVLFGQLIFPAMMVILFSLSGFYNEVYFKSRTGNLINTVGISLLGAIIIFFIALFNDSISDRFKSYEMVMMLWLLLSVVTFVPRWLINDSISKKIKNREISFGTLIVGLSDKAVKLSQELTKRYPDMGFNVLGFVDDTHLTEPPGKLKGTDLPILGLKDLDEAIPRMGIDSFIVVANPDNFKHTVDTINALFPTGKAVYLTPDVHHLVAHRPRTQMVQGEVLIDVSKSNTPASTLNIKRVSDAVIAAITLIVISPLLGVLAVLVKRSSPGPIIYKQERIGYKKKKFMIYKFRTMYTDSEANGPALSSENDPRITPIGRTLRKYRLDELPQFWNVLKGDMSLVGPRPERAYYLQQIISRAPYFSLLQQVRPGITSWGMVKYGYATDVDQMIKRANYDLLYIDNVSLIVDLKILLYTLDTVMKGRGM